MLAQCSGHPGAPCLAQWDFPLYNVQFWIHNNLSSYKDETGAIIFTTKWFTPKDLTDLGPFRPQCKNQFRRLLEQILNFEAESRDQGTQLDRAAILQPKCQTWVFKSPITAEDNCHFLCYPWACQPLPLPGSSQQVRKGADDRIWKWPSRNSHVCHVSCSIKRYTFHNWWCGTNMTGYSEVRWHVKRGCCKVFVPERWIQHYQVISTK